MYARKIEYIIHARILCVYIIWVLPKRERERYRGRDEKRPHYSCHQEWAIHLWRGRANSEIGEVCKGHAMEMEVHHKLLYIGNVSFVGLHWRMQDSAL